MAQVANTYSSYDDKRKREEYADAIHNVDPEETPALTLIGRESISSTNPEWNTDTFRAPAANQKIEGDEFSYDAVTPTVKLRNYAQISRVSFIVTRTQEKFTKAGPKSELGYQRRKFGVELKKDMEYAILQNNASVAGDDSTARELAGLPTWITTAASRGATGADGGFNTTTKIVDAATNGTQRAMTLALLKETVLANHQAGGKARTLMLSPYLKTVFSSFMSDASVAAFRTQASGNKQGTLYGAADTWLSDFGTIDVLPNRVMGTDAGTARNALLIDPEYASVGIFDDIHEVKPAKTGDAEKRVLLCEYTLIVKNEKAHGVVADLFGMSAAA